MNLIESLTDIYFNHEDWHRIRLSREDAIYYHETLMRKGRILTQVDGDKLLGYVESWRINFEQFGRLICQAPFSACEEDVESGDILYIANTWIAPEHRGGVVYRALKAKVLSQNYMCSYFVGEALRKKHQPIKVFKRSKIEELING